jgi:hypothetical protein
VAGCYSYGSAPLAAARWNSELLNEYDLLMDYVPSACSVE